ncbi:hypothetical protein JM16_005890 [Phytophthora kernoviae]|uniref:Abnormal spindle-like microcephaly-associated protein ASH domain-containing protein n=1 Tax=Phytophthora kernoviae TaxID=325452 RepID=A0A8T0LTN6_9STRA|nr:hypothetical protein JM16_005890 [Phytophthora kernoviae]
MSEQAWSQLEYLQVVSPGTSPVRSAVDLLGSEQRQGTSLEVGPFFLTPNEVELDKGESVTFNLVYTPTGVGEQRERFVMVCDNCLVRIFQIVGRGCQVDITATRVNDSPIDANVAEMGPLDHMIFPNEILVNGQAQQTIVITNDTPLDIKYSWKIYPLLQETRNEGMNEDSNEKAMMVPLPPQWSPPFRVVPDSGVFALSSSKEFTIEFLPTEARTYVCQATLMINDIPACSMPGPEQMSHLKAAFKAHDDSPLTPRVEAARKLQDSMPGFSLQLHGRNDTERSLFTSRDILPRATVAFAPESGMLAPGETFTVKATCLAGSLPERFRGFFRCQAAPERLFFGVDTRGVQAVVSARAEIQSPNVFLSTTRMPLGTTYMGVEARRTIELVNVSNLEAAFKFVEPEGRGVAFQLLPDRVHIPPWEQVVVRVTCFNNMPGTYVDDIVSRATGAPPVFLHANVGIVGTPLALDRNCVGLHFGKPVPVGRVQQLLREPTLHFGAVCVRAASITRTLRVTNRGPQCARLKWKLVENGREDHLVTVTLRVDFGSRLQLRITPCDDENYGANALPFKVEPPTAIVPAFSTTPFRITFEPSKDGVAEPRALLLADAHWYDTNPEGNHSTVDTEDSISRDSEGDSRQEDPASPSRHSNNNSGGAAHAVAAGKAFAAVPSRLIVLRIVNPTVVPARFAVQHVPRPKPVSRAQQQEMNQHHAHSLDEPNVFTFSTRSGELRGPTTTLKSAGGWLPTTDSTKDLLGENATTTHPLVHAPLELRVEFHPRESGQHYKSRFRFAVEHGRDFEVVLEGVGHLDEVDDPCDADRPLVRVKELQHSFHIFRGSSPQVSLHKQTVNGTQLT